MKQNDNSQSPQGLGELISALLDGSIDDRRFALLNVRLRDDSEARRLYLDYLQIHEDLPDLAFYESQYRTASSSLRVEVKPADDRTGAAGSRRILLASFLVTLLLLPGALLLGMYLGNGPAGAQVAQLLPPAETMPTELTESETASNAQFANLARAKFFGTLRPKRGTAPLLKRDYSLMEGMVELAFPNGATAIIEGPASFRVEGDELLALDLGRCSVHAPPGAEGFRVETPEVNVVDRGTRFAVNVSQENTTDVQVVEGAADVYRKDRDNLPNSPLASSPVRLEDSDARRFSYANAVTALPLPFNQQLYQRQLPDRIVSYEATTNDSGRIDQLVTLTVQRGGRVESIPVERLIPSKLIWFHAQESHGYVIGNEQLPTPPASWLADTSLRTGVINLGGSARPLTTDPVLTIDETQGDFGTPGMAIRFNRPVHNGPGADVVLFELQMFANPVQGDGFHVSPLKFEPGLHSYSIKEFDLTVDSPEALPLADVFLHKYEQVPRSLAELETLASHPVTQACKFHAIAVGIDLSDLGYPEGALVEGLFFQDDLADVDYLDPILIVGLPEREES